MGFLNMFKKTDATLRVLPRGSFTVDREGRVLASTLPQSFSNEFAEEIGREVLTAFQAAQKAQMAVNEFIIRYANLKLTARELRGGAIIFIVPQNLSGTPN